MRSLELDILYDKLDYKSGGLYPVTNNPSDLTGSNDWLEKGEWLAAAKRAGAEKIFFVDNNPVVVFTSCDGGIEEKIKAFNRTWCLARPRLLFLASPGEITVYDLAQKPINENKQDDWGKLESLITLNALGDVAHELQAYHRDHLESGRLFADERFGNLDNRADKALIGDLKAVRRELIRAGLDGPKVRFAHALIGRSIFIRYLEDRGILTEDYFLQVARQNPDWGDLLSNPARGIGIDFSSRQTFYPRVLADKAFTYALFRRLARDFNGDMFPDVDAEEAAVTPAHLKLVQGLLYGQDGIQKNLFFYSYNFAIIPLDLISSIYEEFYHIPVSEDKKDTRKRQDGAYYTPPVLVEFVLSRLLTPEVIEKKPRVLDPACGSGIFLVEAFRRFVRYNWFKNRRPPTFDELKLILKEQIAGLEINEEAARITAFSLYLSMLHYLDPPSITQQIKAGNRLPNLLADPNNSGENHFHCILPGNAFDMALIESNPTWQERFGKGCADVIVGNPPWGATGKDADQETKTRHQKLVDWCKTNSKPIGDKEPSQAFLWRALDFLKENGKAGMLVSAGVLFKHHDKSQAFRKQWLEGVRLTEVFNFSHIRTIFFKGAISPFLAIFFSRAEQADHPVYYWTPKQYPVVKKVQSILLSKNDLRIIQNSNLSDYRIWKINTWGSHLDRKFLGYLNHHPYTISLESETLFSRVGFIIGNRRNNADWLSKYKKVKITAFSRYEKLDQESFEEVPSEVQCYGGGEDSFNGQRIVVLEAPRQADGANGRIEARFETEPYAYNHSFHILKLSDGAGWKYRVVIGILWSSFAKYYLFLTTYFWGLWRDKILLNERRQLPVVLDQANPATAKVIAIVDQLRSFHPLQQDITEPGGMPGDKIEAQRREWEAQLDDAVFELYGLNEEQIDLIHDLCDVTLPFYYNPLNSLGAMPAVKNGDLSWIDNYVHTFCRRWNAYLGEDEEMRAEVHLGAHGNIVAVEFFPADRHDPWHLIPKEDTWSYILEEIGKALPQPLGTSQIILDGLVHIVSDRGIIVIKRNEKRFWTRSLAREDADAALCKRMTLPQEGRPA